MKKHDDMSMPKVGDKLMKTMTSTSFMNSDDRPELCVVVYCNKPKHYYVVEFVESGVREAYKLPCVDEIGFFKRDYTRAFGKRPQGIYVYESGALYSSIRECAEALGVSPSTVSAHLHGRTSHVKGYHIFTLD